MLAFRILNSAFATLGYIELENSSGTLWTMVDASWYIVTVRFLVGVFGQVCLRPYRRHLSVPCICSHVRHGIPRSQLRRSITLCSKSEILYIPKWRFHDTDQGAGSVVSICGVSSFHRVGIWTDLSCQPSSRDVWPIQRGTTTQAGWWGWWIRGWEVRSLLHKIIKAK